MTKIWITYAWDDNKNNEVDFIAQELENKGIHVRLDRWDINAGRRLWEQIDNIIQNPEESDAWLIYTTSNSLSSQACKEEYAYALDRALHTRGSEFPLIALFPGSVDRELIPAGIRIRLYVSLANPNWVERIISAAEGRNLKKSKLLVSPYYLQIYRNPTPDRNFAIELRPRAGTWSPFMVAIPIEENDIVKPSILPGPVGMPPNVGRLDMPKRGPSQDNEWWTISAHNEATPTRSYFFFCNKLPSRLIFGQADRAPQYNVTFENDVA